MSEALDDLLELGLQGCAPATVTMYEQKSGHLERLLGDVDVNELTLDSWLRYAQVRTKEGANIETVRKEQVTLRRALKFAEARERFDGNIGRLLPKIKGHSRPRNRWVTREEFVSLLSLLSAHHPSWLYVAVYAGPRLSEIELLQWEDIEAVGSQKWLHIRGEKTAKSNRRIPLSTELQRVLESLPGDHRGKLVTRWSNVRRDLAKACVKLEIPKVTPNDLRRTFASWMLQAGATTLCVAKLLGHTSTRMVEQVYGHLMDQNLVNAVDSLLLPRTLVDGFASRLTDVHHRA